MTRPKLLTKDVLIDLGRAFIIKYDIRHLTARSLAKEYGFSTQPIYHTFENMEIYKHEILTAIHTDMIENHLHAKDYDPDPLVNLAINFIHYAQNNPELYYAMFVSGYADNALLFDRSIKNYRQVLDQHDRYKDLDDLHKDALHTHTWIIVNGMATASLAGIRNYTDTYLARIMKDTINIILNNPSPVDIQPASVPA
jgi:AcrR family transcriptional regulator